MSNKLTGHYVTHRDGGVMYEYETMWTTAGGRIFWDSKVSRDGAIVGTPGGLIPTIPPGSELEELVRLNVHDMIEAKFSGI